MPRRWLRSSCGTTTPRPPRRRRGYHRRAGAGLRLHAGRRAQDLGVPGRRGGGPARAPRCARSCSSGRGTSWGRAGAAAGWCLSSRASACGSPPPSSSLPRSRPRASPCSGLGS